MVANFLQPLTPDRPDPSRDRLIEDTVYRFLVKVQRDQEAMET